MFPSRDLPLFFVLLPTALAPARAAPMLSARPFGLNEELFRSEPRPLCIEYFRSLLPSPADVHSQGGFGRASFRLEFCGSTRILRF